MGIFQVTGANRTITQGDRALRLFADRMPGSVPDLDIILKLQIRID
jgi:hypothetical protein